MSKQYQQFDLPDGSVDVIDAFSWPDPVAFWFERLGVDPYVGLSWCGYEDTIDDLYRIASESSRTTAVASFIRRTLESVKGYAGSGHAENVVRYAASWPR